MVRSAARTLAIQRLQRIECEAARPVGHRGGRPPGLDPTDNVLFLIDDDVCTRCALCVDRCPTGVIIMGKVGDPSASGDPHGRTNSHGYGYGMRLG